MRRWVAVVAIAVCLSPVRLGAQTTIFTVTVASAGIRQSPSADSPVVGYKTKGDVLEVRRNLGAWIEVAWPTTPTGVAYVGLAMGALTQSTQAPRRPMTIAEYTATSSPITPSLAPTAATCACAQAAAVSASAARTPSAPSAAMQPATPYIAPTHLLGFGAQMVGAISVRNAGATGRVWSRKDIGVQIDFSRVVRNGGTVRLTSQQFASSALYSLPNRMNDYVWLRPYVGGGTILYRTELSSALLAVAEPRTGNALGLQAFGGTELTFAAAPRLALSADVGYHKWPQTFAIFGPRKVALRVSGHWYVR
jgi:hypothetical protein